MRCEAKLAKREAIGWNAYAEQFQQLDALWGKIGKNRGYELNCYAEQVQQLDALFYPKFAQITKVHKMSEVLQNFFLFVKDLCFWRSL